MRLLAATALTLGCAATTAAVGAAVFPSPAVEQSQGDRALDANWSRLKAAVFTPTPGLSLTTGAGPARGPAVEAGLEPDFRQPAITGMALDAPNAFATETYVPGEGMARWRVSEMAIARPAVGAVDAVRISIGQVVRRPGGLPPEQDQWSEADTEAYQVTYTRGWPALMAVDAGEYDLDFTPHAGVGISNAGGEAEAGALVRLHRKAQGWADRLGVQDGARFGDQGRWYLFAAASGRAVGLNLQRKAGDWSNGGVSTDPASALVSDVQAGVGWRRGSVQASLAWMRRKVRAAQGLMGWDNRDDSMVAVSISIKPRR